MSNAFNVLNSKVSNKIKKILLSLFSKNGIVVDNIAINAISIPIQRSSYLLVHVWWDDYSNNHFYIFDSNNDLVYHIHDNYFPERYNLARILRIKDIFTPILKILEDHIISVKEHNKWIKSLNGEPLEWFSNNGAGLTPLGEIHSGYLSAYYEEAEYQHLFMDKQVEKYSGNCDCKSVEYHIVKALKSL